ncbi:SEC-C metal-binding domain-containing protein [Peribacillus frigoritolerans]
MRTIDPFEILDGKAIKYLDVFGVEDGIALKSKYEDKSYWIYDYYCMHQTCDCQEVYLEFVEELKGNKQAGQHFGVRVSFGDNQFVLEDYNISKQKAMDIAEDTLKYSKDVMELFKQRYQQMKEKGTEIITESAKAAKMPHVHAEPVIGRNEPCPCGSGKKYKKCCGAA